MGKHEAPAFRMTIERGKLVPATPYDAERLDTYRHGMLVYVRFTEDKDRVLVRKWWAIIGRAVKDCKTPWKTRDEASEAIKLALGIVNLTKTVGGDYLAYPKSLTELDDPELQEAVDQMKQIIFNVTGVDPDEWRKELAGLDDVEQESSEGPSPADEGSGDLVPPDIDPAAAEIASQGVNGEAEQSNVGDGPAASSASSDLSDEDREWLKLAAKMLWAATGVGEQDVLKGQMAGIREHHTPATIGDQARAKANSINSKCKLVCFGEASAADVLPLIAGIAGCDVKDIT